MKRWSVIAGVAATLGGLLYVLLGPGLPQTSWLDGRSRRADTRPERGSSQKPVSLAQAPIEESSGLLAPESDVEEEDAPGTLSVRGVVTDADGHPLEGVSVGAWLPEFTDEDGALTLEPEAGDTTDSQGRFRLRSLAPRHYRLIFDRTRFLAQMIGDYALSAESQPLVVVLLPAPTLEGRVVDAEGNPLPGVDITLEGVALVGSEVFEPSTPEVRQSLFYGVGTDRARLHSEETTTGPDGTFVLDTPKPGTWSLRAEVEGFFPVVQEVAVPSRDLWIVMGEGASVEATIVDEQDRPVAGATLGLWEEGSRDPFVAEAPVDEAGRAVLQGLKLGRYLLVGATPPGVGLRFVTQPLVLSGAEVRRVRLQLGEGASLSGVVEDRSGRPVPDVALRATLIAVPDLSENLPLLQALNRFDGPRRVSTYTARTGADGRFRLPHLLPLTYVVRVEKKGYELVQSPEGSGPVDPGGFLVNGGESGLRVVLAYHGLVSGRVVRHGGEPITSFMIDNTPHESPDGTFEVEAGAPGPHALNFFAKGVGGLRREYVAKEGEDVSLGDLVLGEGRPVRVRVVDAVSSLPIGDVQLAAKDPSEERKLHDVELGLAGSSRTKEDGTLLLPDVPRRPLRLSLQHRAYEGAEVALGPGEDEVSVRLRPWATLQGWVRIDGTAMAEGSVRVSTLGGDRIANLEVKEGWYSAHLVPPGSYFVRAECHSCEVPEPVFLPRRIEVPGPQQRLSLDLESARGGATLEVQSFAALGWFALVRGRPPRPTTLEQQEAAIAPRYAKDNLKNDRYRFRNVPPGPHTLLGVQVREDRPEVFLYEEVEIPASGTVQIELQPR